MTQEEALNTLMKMRAWRAWGKEQKEEERPEMPEQKEVDEAFDVCIELLQQPPLPSDLDEAAEISDLEAKNLADDYTNFLAAGLTNNEPRPIGPQWMKKLALDRFKAGAEWMAGQGWIDDGSMPPETKQESDTLQGHREWTESEPVLAWDSMYGCLVDWTRNGKWMSEQIGGYTGQICHGIIAWRPIPEYKEKQ